MDISPIFKTDWKWFCCFASVWVHMYVTCMSVIATLHLLRHDFALNLALTKAADLDSQLALETLLSLPPKHWNYRLAAMPTKHLRGCWRSELQSSACKAGGPPIELLCPEDGSPKAQVEDEWLLLSLPQAVLMLIYTGLGGGGEEVCSCHFSDSLKWRRGRRQLLVDCLYFTDKFCLIGGLSSVT